MSRLRHADQGGFVSVGLGTEPGDLHSARPRLTARNKQINLVEKNLKILKIS